MNFVDNKPQMDNEIIAYVNDKAIIKNEANELFYIEIPEEFVTIGETAFPEDLTSFSLLSKKEQADILIKIQSVLI